MIFLRLKGRKLSLSGLVYSLARNLTESNALLERSDCVMMVK